MAITRVTTDGITDSAVSTAKIGANAVDTTKIGADVIVADDIANNAITVSQISDGAVTDAKIAAMAASKLTGALPALDGSALTGAGTIKHIQRVAVASNTGASSTSTSYIALPVTVTVAAADVAKCSTLVIVHYGSTRTDRNTHTFQERRFQRTAPSAVNFNNYFLGSVTGGGESLDNCTICAVDTSLGSGDHTYTVYGRIASGNATYALRFYTAYTSSEIVVMGF